MPRAEKDSHPLEFVRVRVEYRGPVSTWWPIWMVSAKHAQGQFGTIVPTTES